MSESWSVLTSCSSRRASPETTPPLSHLSLCGDLGDVWDRQSSHCLCFLSIPSWSRGTHLRTPLLGRKKRKKKIAKQHRSRPTLIDPRACVKFIVRECQIPLVNSEFVTVLICYLAHAADVRVWKKRNVQDALFLPAETFLICSGFLLFTPISLSPTGRRPTCFSALKVSRQGLVRLVCVCWSETPTHTCNTRRQCDVCCRECYGMSRPVQPAEDETMLFFFLLGLLVGTIKSKSRVCRCVRDDREGSHKLISSRSEQVKLGGKKTEKNKLNNLIKTKIKISFQFCNLTT